MTSGLLSIIDRAEEGHVWVYPAPVVAGIGAILLGVGAANEAGPLCVIGGVVMAVGIVAGAVLQHTQIDYPVYRRLDDLDKK